MHAEIDYSAFVDPVSRAQLQEHLAKNPRPFEPPNPGLAVFGLALFLGCYAVVFLPMLGGGAWAEITYIDVILLVFAPLFSLAFFVVSRGAGLMTIESHYRYVHFAKANGFSFAPSAIVRDYPTTVLSVGGAQDSINYIRSTSGRRLDIGNFQYGGAAADPSTPRVWGYMAMRLDRKLPHMILDSKANNGLLAAAGGGERELPRLIAKNQRLSLEGDFDKHFTLYCPPQYERDALYVFTPDLMALLIDNSAPFDIEIVDDWLFLYSPRAFTVWDHEGYRRLFRIVATVGKKALSQTARYTDERVGDSEGSEIAEQGNRLQRKRLSEPRWQLAMIAAVPTLCLIVSLIADAVSR